MKKIYIIIILICVCLLGNAQVFQKTFNKGNADYGMNCTITSSGEYFLSAYIQGSSVDAGIIKLNVNGDTLWTKMYGGPSIDAGPVFVDGNQPYIIGATGSPSFGEYDIIFIKINTSNGDTLWTKRYGTSWAESIFLPIKTSDGGFLIPALRNILPNIPWNWLLIKTNSDGDTLWTKEYDGGNDDNRFSVLQPNTGGFILCGITKSFGAGDYDVIMCLLDSNGNPITCKTFGGTLGDYFTGIKPCNGGYVIEGSTKNWGAGGDDVMLTKIDTNLNIVWSKVYGTSTDDVGASLEVTSNGDFIIAGRIGLTTSTDWDSYLIKADSSGNLLWSKRFSANVHDYSVSVVETNDKGYLLNGTTANPLTGNDVYLIKTDSMGNSGCNQADVATITTDITSLLQTGTATLTVSNPGLMVAHAPLNMWSGLQISTLCYSGAGMEENESKVDILVYPNPTSGILNAEVRMQNTVFSIQIIDGCGRILFSKNNSTYENSIDLSFLQNGVYYLRIQNDKMSITRKIIKIHQFIY